MSLALELITLDKKRGGNSPAENIGLDSAIKQVHQQKHPEIGEIAPNFRLPDENGNVVALSELLKEGPAILSFYRGDWCPFCDLELKALQRNLADFKKHGASLLGISPQKISYSLVAKEKRNLEYSLLSDKGNELARTFGLLYTPPVEMENAFKSFGLDLGEMNADASSEMPIPATYVVGTDQKIIFAFIDPDHTKRAEPSDILASLM